MYENHKLEDAMDLDPASLDNSTKGHDLHMSSHLVTGHDASLEIVRSGRHAGGFLLKMALQAVVGFALGAAAMVLILS